MKDVCIRRSWWGIHCTQLVMCSALYTACHVYTDTYIAYHMHAHAYAHTYMGARSQMSTHTHCSWGWSASCAGDGAIQVWHRAHGRVYAQQDGLGGENNKQITKKSQPCIFCHELCILVTNCDAYCFHDMHEWRFKYDMVLMDGFMPNKTGWEVWFVCYFLVCVCVFCCMLIWYLLCICLVEGFTPSQTGWEV